MSRNNFFLEYDEVDLVMMSDPALDKLIEEAEADMNNEYHSPLSEYAQLDMEVLSEADVPVDTDDMSDIQTGIGFEQIDDEVDDIEGADDDVYHMDMGDIIDKMID